MKNESCAGCANDLGGGCCKINMEAECREGGGFELWEPKEAPKKEPEKVEHVKRPLTRSEEAIKWAIFGLILLFYPVVIYRLILWIMSIF